MIQSENESYTPDQARVAKYIMDTTGIGGGADPIGFLIASHMGLRNRNNQDLMMTAHAEGIDTTMHPTNQPCAKCRPPFVITAELALKVLVEYHADGGDFKKTWVEDMRRALEIVLNG